MARKLSIQNLVRYKTATYEGASAYDYSTEQPLIHLTFTMGSALFTDGFYESEVKQVRRYAEALIDAWRAEPKFAWQYAAWMRDPKNGKGNRIQGSLAPALLDALVDESAHNEEYIAQCLSHRPDDVTAFVRHFQRLGLGRPSASARRGMARALTHFDEYQLTKYAEQKADDVRLCDAIAIVSDELVELGEAGRLARDVGRYLHASSRDRDELAGALALTSARRALWKQPVEYALDGRFQASVREARVTWEQVLSHFGAGDDKVRRAVWEALLQTKGLLGDMAFMRNVRNMVEAGVPDKTLLRHARNRVFAEVWPHQVYAGYRAVPGETHLFDAIFGRMVDRLPKGRHLGIGDASGSMGVRVGGHKGSLTCMDVAFCLVGLMSETSGLGASFCDDSFLQWSDGGYLTMVEREYGDSPLDFSDRRDLRRGMGGTQVFGAVMDLVTWLKRHDHVRPPDCLWFFSDMQFHPGAGGADAVPAELLAEAKKRGLGTNVPPLELALNLYRSMFGPVDVVLWNLAAYAPVPVPAEMQGVLLVSGFDANTLDHVAKWRDGGEVGTGRVEQNQEVILDTVRSY